MNKVNQNAYRKIVRSYCLNASIQFDASGFFATIIVGSIILLSLSRLLPSAHHQPWSEVVQLLLGLNCFDLQASSNSSSQEGNSLFESAFRVFSNMRKSKDVLDDGIREVQK